MVFRGVAVKDLIFLAIECHAARPDDVGCQSLPTFAIRVSHLNRSLPLVRPSHVASNRIDGNADGLSEIRRNQGDSTRRIVHVDGGNRLIVAIDVVEKTRYPIDSNTTGRFHVGEPRLVAVWRRAVQVSPIDAAAASLSAPIDELVRGVKRQLTDTLRRNRIVDAIPLKRGGVQPRRYNRICFTNQQELICKKINDLNNL